MILVVLLLVTLPLKSSSQIRQTEDDSSRIHRLHVLMNQGLIMFLDGIEFNRIRVKKHGKGQKSHRACLAG
jgi:hypothetical protein